MSEPRVERVQCEGGEMDLFVWQPDQPAKGAILVIQEILGVGAYIRAVAQRLADAGYLVGSPDVFWRFAPGWAPNNDQAGLEASFAQAAKLDPPQAIADCVAALDHLRGQPGIDGVGVIGFCLGGTLAWGVAAEGSPDVCVSYYGSGVSDMLGMIDQVSCPTLFHFGNEDPYITNDSIDAVAAAIAGHPGLVINVENAGHAFDNHESAIFYNESAANAAWPKTMAFLASNLAT